MKKVIMLITVLFTTLLISSSAFADNVSLRVYLSSDAQNGVFIVSWANTSESAAVTLSDPNGRIVTADSTNAVFEPGRVTISVANAACGYWTVNADGNELGSVSVSGGSLDGISGNSTESSIINDFTASYNNGLIDFAWNVTTDNNMVDLSVYLDGSNGSSSIYYDPSAPSVGRGSADVSTFATGIYKVHIVASVNGYRSTKTVEDYFYIEQKDAGDKLIGVRAGSVDGEFFILWESGFASDSFVVTLYDYDTMSVINTARVYENRFSTPLENIPEKLKYSVSDQSSLIWGSFDVFEYEKRTVSGEVVFPETSITRDESVSVNIICDDGSASVYIDEKQLNDNLKSGEYDLFLSEGEHNILILVSDAYGNLKTFEKSITVDKTPPVITLNNNDSEVIDGDSIIISGSTEPNVVIAVNGVEQNSTSGAFSVKVGVERGISSITVSAYDAAGNKTVRSITVERKGSVSLVIFEIIAVAVVCAGLLVWYFILNKRGKEVYSNEQN